MSDKSAINKARGVDEPLVLSPCSPCQSPDLLKKLRLRLVFSSQILECQAESSQKDSKIHSESTPADSKNASNSRTISESTLSHSYSISKYRTLDSHSPSCHSEPLGEESISHTSRDISNFRPQYDKRIESASYANLESNTDSESTSGGVYIHRDKNKNARSANLEGVVGVGAKK